MELIKKRYLEVLEENRLKQKDIAIKLGVNQGSISQTFGKGKITKVEYYIALQELTNCNLNWVISGIGNKYLAKVPSGDLPLVAEDVADYGAMRLMMDTYKLMAQKYDEMQAKLDAIARKIEEL